jgi:hypothetical protein
VLTRFTSVWVQPECVLLKPLTATRALYDAFNRAPWGPYRGGAGGAKKTKISHPARQETEPGFGFGFCTKIGTVAKLPPAPVLK